VRDRLQGEEHLGVEISSSKKKKTKGSKREKGKNHPMGRLCRKSIPPCKGLQEGASICLGAAPERGEPSKEEVVLRGTVGSGIGQYSGKL